ncbi:MAG: VWA domain-containing protein [Vicinamibacteria bacterium]|nr:VWA domain-containing protein [Vicinamibacteria bacterium]
MKDRAVSIPLQTRWRLVLGQDAEACGLTLGGDADARRIDNLVGFLFGDDGAGGAPSGGRGAGSQSSGLTVPEWVAGVRELFPNEAREVLERELVRRRGIRELLDQPELLERIEPSVDLVRTLLTHKDLFNEKTRMLARKVIEDVVRQLKERMQVQVETSVTGAIRRDRHSPRRVFRNLDLRTTLRRNLRHYDAKREKLLVDRIYYFGAERRRRPWHVIIAVDQSGSMLDSAIYSAVMASIFHELPSVSTSLFLFDTRVVDLTSQVGEPVDVLLSIQLGGGTLIREALRYAEQLVREPGRTIVVLITDFYEGAPEDQLVRQVEEMAQSGTRMIGLGALGYDARPAYNRETAKKLQKAGMDILACTPEKLAECMAEIIRG